jgi:hypothetical protein
MLGCRSDPLPVASLRLIDPHGDSAQQGRQLFRKHFDGIGFHRWGRPPKGSALKAFAADPESGAVPVEKFGHVAPFVGKPEKMSALGESIDGALLNHRAQSIEAFAHICVARKEVDLGVRTDG